MALRWCKDFGAGDAAQSAVPPARNQRKVSSFPALKTYGTIVTDNGSRGLLAAPAATTGTTTSAMKSQGSRAATSRSSTNPALEVSPNSDGADPTHGRGQCGTPR